MRSNASFHAPLATRGAAPRYASMIPPSFSIQSTDSSFTFQMSPSRPPGRRTRWISASAASPSNQWNACPTVTASTERSGNGIASAVPATASTSGSDDESAARIASTGSTATTNAPVGTRRRVSFPVPAARSSTRLPSSSPSSATSRSIASGGYGGLPISYGLGACSKPRAASWMVPARELTRRTG